MSQVLWLVDVISLWQDERRQANESTRCDRRTAAKEMRWFDWWPHSSHWQTTDFIRTLISMWRVTQITHDFHTHWPWSSRRKIALLRRKNTQPPWSTVNGNYQRRLILLFNKPHWSEQFSSHFSPLALGAGSNVHRWAYVHRHAISIRRKREKSKYDKKRRHWESIGFLLFGHWESFYLHGERRTRGRELTSKWTHSKLFHRHCFNITGG